MPACSRATSFVSPKPSTLAAQSRRETNGESLRTARILAATADFDPRADFSVLADTTLMLVEGSEAAAAAAADVDARAGLALA